MHDQPENTSGIMIVGRRGRSKASIDLTRRTGPAPRGTTGHDAPVVYLDPMSILGGVQQ